MKTPSAKRRQRGATLIEVLVAMFILAIGLLGMASMTAASVKFNQLARMRGVGVTLVNDIAERARANAMGFDAGGYDNSAGKTYSFSSTAAAVNANCEKAPGTATCTDADIAAYDLNQWLAEVNTRLPGGDAMISTTSANVSGSAQRSMDVFLMWTEATTAQSLDSSTAVGNSSANSCPASVLPRNTDTATTGIRCMYFRVVL